MVAQQVIKLDTTAAARIFGVPKENLERPSGPVELLLGSNNACIFLVAIRWEENLRIRGSPFGTRMFLDGSHPDVRHLRHHLREVNCVTSADKSMKTERLFIPTKERKWMLHNP